MPRIRRHVVEGIPHHVTQRGNGGQRIFAHDGDRRLYLEMLRENAEIHRLRIWGYCLMPNHIHLICVPERAESLQRALGRTHADYARWHNMQQRTCGHLWQARFYSCPLTWPHLWCALAYVERNPVRAGFVEDATQYRWSSAAAHTQPHAEDRLLEFGPWDTEYGCHRWTDVLRSSVGEEALGERLRQATRRGRLLLDSGFASQIEEMTGRRIGPLASHAALASVAADTVPVVVPGG